MNSLIIKYYYTLDFVKEILIFLPSKGALCFIEIAFNASSSFLNLTKHIFLNSSWKINLFYAENLLEIINF